MTLISRPLISVRTGLERRCADCGIVIGKEDARYQMELYGHLAKFVYCSNCADRVKHELSVRRSQQIAKERFRKKNLPKPEMSESIKGWLYGVGSSDQGNKQAAGANS